MHQRLPVYEFFFLLLPKRLPSAHESLTLSEHSLPPLQAKAEYEKVVSAVGGPKAGLGSEGVRVSPGVPRPSTGEVSKLSELALSWNPALRERLQCLRQELNDFSGFALAPAPPRPPDTAEAPPRNPFDISRASLLHQVARMRARYLHPGTVTRLQDAGEELSLSILLSLAHTGHL